MKEETYDLSILQAQLVNKWGGNVSKILKFRYISSSSSSPGSDKGGIRPHRQKFSPTTTTTSTSSSYGSSQIKEGGGGSTCCCGRATTATDNNVLIATGTDSNNNNNDPRLDMDSIVGNIRNLLEGKPYEEMHEFCDFTLEDQNDIAMAKGIQPSASSDFQPIIKKTVTYIVAAVLFNKHGEVLMMQVIVAPHWAVTTTFWYMFWPDAGQILSVAISLMGPVQLIHQSKQQQNYPFAREICFNCLEHSP